MNLAKSSQKANANIRSQLFSSPKEMTKTIVTITDHLKEKMIIIQKSMSIYLANRDTEAILFKPIWVSCLL